MIADPLETRQADLSGLARSIRISPKVEPVDTRVTGSEVRRLRIATGSPFLPARPRIVNPVQRSLGRICRKQGQRTARYVPESHASDQRRMVAGRDPAPRTVGS